jgi:mannobiose 2-epimerase
MNTHLHVLEPYTNLYRIWQDPQLATAQRRLIDIFTERILDKNTNHLNLFFDEEWNLKSSGISYGHDIEASWLLYEAAVVLDDAELTEKIRQISLKIADAAAEGLQPDGSMIYEISPLSCGEGLEEGLDRHWWVQAETVVGFMYAHENAQEGVYYEYAQRTWQYIQDRLIDRKNGEWYWSRKADGSINHEDDKAGFWKCPYHNSRMCMEVLEMLNK